MKTPMNAPAPTQEDDRAIGRTVLVDGLLAIAIAVTIVAPFLFYNDAIVIYDEESVSIVGSSWPDRSSWWIAAVALAIAAPITVRRLWPRTAFAATLLLTVSASVPVVVSGTSGVSVFLLGMNLPLMVVVFTFANLVDRWSAAVIGFVAASCIVASSLLPFAFDDGMVGLLWLDVLNNALYAVTPVVLVVIVAQVLREQRLRADAAQREAAMAMVSAELRAASAASLERRRLASELHDIVAHHVSLMVVQAEKGPFVRDAAAASRTFTTIGETGRAALGELDRLLGVLRTDGTGSTGSPQMAPLPTIEEIPSLVDAANRAGVSVLLRAFDPPPVVEPAVSATVHRIVQECVTNVVKHADRSEAAILSVTHAESVITVRMENRSGGSERGARRGHGLDSMRSRLEVFGGSLVADERDGRFCVEALVPFTVPVGNPSGAVPVTPVERAAVST